MSTQGIEVAVVPDPRLEPARDARDRALQQSMVASASERRRRAPSVCGSRSIFYKLRGSRARGLIAAAEVPAGCAGKAGHRTSSGLAA